MGSGALHPHPGVRGRHHRHLLWIQNRTTYYRKSHGRLAGRWLRAVLRLWALECNLRIRLGSREASAKRRALDELDGFLRECARA